jgi:hypothetical protein
VVDWLKSVPVTEARSILHQNAEMVRVRAVDRRGRNVSILCSPRQNFVPVHVEYTTEGGGIVLSADVTYRQLAKGDSWFPSKAVVSRFDGGPEGKQGPLTCRATYRVGEVVPAEAAEDTFDVFLPQGTRFTDGFNGRSGRLREGQPAFSVPLRKKEPSERRLPSSTNAFIWLLDGTIILACMAFRKQLGF